jgi:hypothetical protein
MRGEYSSPSRALKIPATKPQARREEAKLRPRVDGGNPGSCLLQNPNDSYVDRLTQYLLKKRVVDKLQQKSATDAKK